MAGKGVCGQNHLFIERSIKVLSASFGTDHRVPLKTLANPRQASKEQRRRRNRLAAYPVVPNLECGKTSATKSRTLT